MDIATLDHELNQQVLRGETKEAFEKFYADDVVMQENSEPACFGKEANRIREQEFYGAMEQVYEARLELSAVQGDVTFGQWFMDFQIKGGPRVSMTQTAVRQWKDGKVAHERFFYAK